MTFLCLIGLILVVQGLPAPNSNTATIIELKTLVESEANINQNLKRPTRDQPETLSSESQEYASAVSSHQHPADAVTLTEKEYIRLLRQEQHSKSHHLAPQLAPEAENIHRNVRIGRSNSEHEPPQQPDAAPTEPPQQLEAVHTELPQHHDIPIHSTTHESVPNSSLSPPLSHDKKVVVKVNIPKCPTILDVVSASTAVSDGMRKAEGLKVGLGVVLNAASDSLSSVVGCLGKIISDFSESLKALPHESIATVKISK